MLQMVSQLLGATQSFSFSAWATSSYNLLEVQINILPSRAELLRMYRYKSIMFSLPNLDSSAFTNSMAKISLKNKQASHESSSLHSSDPFSQVSWILLPLLPYLMLYHHRPRNILLPEAAEHQLFPVNVLPKQSLSLSEAKFQNKKR